MKYLENINKHYLIYVVVAFFNLFLNFALLWLVLFIWFFIILKYN
jgi:hypothetical protein